MQLKKLFDNYELDKRAYNICRFNNLFTVEEVYKHFLKSRTFLDLRNCGNKTNRELIELCEKFKFDLSLFRNIENFNSTQIDVLDNYIESTLSNLSVRARNALNIYLMNDCSYLSFSNRILNNNFFDVAQLNNVGRKTAGEILKYIDKLDSFTIEIRLISDYQTLKQKKFEILIKSQFNIDELPSELIETKSIVKLSHYLIEEELLFQDRTGYIFKHGLKIYTNAINKGVEEIANEIGLTRERVRQLRSEIFEKIEDSFSFLNKMDDDFFENYQIDINDDYLFINTALSKSINHKFGTKFSSMFLTFIFSIYLKKKFGVIGNIEDVLITKGGTARKRHNWKHIYLLRSDLLNLFDFIGFANDIHNRNKEKISEDYSFNFKSYLSKFLISNESLDLNIIYSLAESVLLQEFGVVLDLEDNISFNRNTSKQVYEYAYEALSLIGNPSHITEIHNKVLELYPNYKTDPKRIRASLKRKNGFVPIGRTSVFGLKKWENELDGFKGGTIRSIVEEFLQLFDEPIHIKRITNHVKKFRPSTNLKSILHNLQLDDSGIFVKYQDSKVGLSTKKYSNNFIKQSRISKIKKTWEDQYEHLITFLNSANRLPRSSGVSEEEKKIYRWLMSQKRGVNKGKVKGENAELIVSIFKKYRDLYTSLRQFKKN